MRKKAMKTTRSKRGGKKPLLRKTHTNTEKLEQWERRRRSQAEQRLSEGHPPYSRTKTAREEARAW
jgi:hypothetical protein